MGVKFCTQCGKKNDSGNRFCIYCGHSFAEDQISENAVEEIEDGESDAVEEQAEPGVFPSPKTPVSLYEKHKIREKHEPVKTFEFWKVLLFSIITCGIYGIYVYYHLIQGLNKICEGDEEESPNVFKVIFFSIFTYGVYALYWSYVQSQRMYEAAKGYRAEVKEKGWTILLWETVGCVLFCTGPVVALYKIIKNYNLLAERYNQGVVNYKIREMSQEERDKKKNRKKIAEIIGMVYVALLTLGVMVSIIDGCSTKNGHKTVIDPDAKESKIGVSKTLEELESESTNVPSQQQSTEAEPSKESTEAMVANEKDKIKNPMGIYYVTPHCMEMDIYEGDTFQDYYLYYIYKSSENLDNIVVIESSFVDSVTNRIEMAYNTRNDLWFGSSSERDAYLYYDEYLKKYIFKYGESNTVCLENITENSAWNGESPEGCFTAELGTKNGLTYFVYDLFNTGCLAGFSTNNSDEVNKYVASKDERYKYYFEYNIYPKDGDIFNRLKEGESLTRLSFHEYSIPNLTIEDWEGVSDGYASSVIEVAELNRANSFDGYRSPDSFSGTYQISGNNENMYIFLDYNENAETFYYKIYKENKTIASGTDAIIHGINGYGIISPEFLLDFTGYAWNNSETAQIIIPKLGETSFEVIIE